MGQVAVQTLLRNESINHVIVADNDPQRLKSFVESLDTERASAKVVDISDEAALVEVMREGDVVMNTSGPYYRYGVAVVRAVIEARRNYADMDDDWRPTQQVLELDVKAREAGISVVVGIGSSPGATNLLAKHAAAQLDRVDAVHTAWGSLGGPRPPVRGEPSSRVAWSTSCTVLVGRFLRSATASLYM